MENPVKPQKSKTYLKAKGMSFFAFLFSIVIYISVFYVFSLPPSALFSNTKFWFVISNTLILIIAADYGAFSSAKEKLDFHEEYSLHSQARSMASSFVSQYPEVAKKSIHPNEEEIIKKEDDDNIVLADQKNEIVPAERILQVVKIEPLADKYPPENSEAKSQQEHEQRGHGHEHEYEQPMKADHHHNKVIKNEPRTIRRSKSDKVKRVAFHDKEHVLKRTGTEKHETIAKENDLSSSSSSSSASADEQENEFSAMSDEELNRRVEEFIQNFNRQIRLQGARSRQLLEFE